MGISDITAESVVAACQEYDELGKTRFLTKYGFGASKTYHLLHEQKHYDSKAIAGAAHGFLGLNYEPLKAKDFSGGLQETVRKLESLGFKIVENPPPTRNPDWSRDELILATEFYQQYAPRIPGKTSRKLIDLADDIRATATMQGLVGNDTFRNPNGVYMKLMELRKYDETYAGVRLGHERQRDVELEVFTLPETTLLLAAQDIRNRIKKYRDEGGQVPTVGQFVPKSVVLQELLASDDALENQLADALIEWQEFKRVLGKFPGLGREPGQIRRHGAVYVIEQRVRSGASGFDEVSATGESYEEIVVKHPDRFPSDVVQIAKERLADFDLAKPTDDRGELEKKVGGILARPDMISEPPAGNHKPKAQLATGSVYIRDPRVVAYTQKRANGICELCYESAPFRRPDDTPYLETHHVVPLAEGGPDTVDNCAAVCPNCHRALHSSGDRAKLADKLRASIAVAKSA